MFKYLQSERIIENNNNVDILKNIAYLSDKLKVKDFLSKKNISDLYIAKLYGVFNLFEEINIDDLPETFIIKLTHWCGDTIKINNKNDYFKNYNALKTHFNEKLNKIYRNGAEPHYKYIEPKIIIEEKLGNEIYDYRFHCIWGKVICIMVTNMVNNDFYLFNKDWKLFNFNRQTYNINKNILPIPSLDKLIKIAELLSENINYVRVDLYDIDGKIYFGEYTFTPGGLYSPYFNSNQFENLMLQFLKTKTIDYTEIDKFLL